MNILLKFKKLFIGIIVFLSILYILPYFLHLNIDKTKIEDYITKTTNLSISIDGDISFNIIPDFSIILNNVSVKTNADSKVSFLNAQKVNARLNILDLFKKEIKFTSLKFTNATIYPKNYKALNFEQLLSDSIWKNVYFKNSRIILENSAITNLDLFVKTLADNKISGVGSFNLKDGVFSDLSFLLSYTNSSNYKLETLFNYEYGKTYIKNESIYFVENENRNLSGNFTLNSQKLPEFVNMLNKDIQFPNTNIFLNPIKISAKYQNIQNTLDLIDGFLEGDSVVATFKGNIPFDVINSRFDLIGQKINLNIDFFTLALKNILKFDKKDLFNPLNVIKKNDIVFSWLKNFNLNITAKNIILEKSTIKDLSLKLSPIYEGTDFKNLKIENLEFKHLNKNVSIKGIIENLLKENMQLNFSIKNDIPFKLENKFDANFFIDNFSANIKLSSDEIIMDMLKGKINNNPFEATFSSIKTDKNTDYTFKIKADSFDIASAFKTEINFPFIIEKLSLLKNDKINLALSIPSFILNNQKNQDFKLNATYSDGTLQLKSFSFKNSDYMTKMSGNLVDITKQNGKFENFNYEVSAKILKGFKLPFINNDFIEKIISNGVNFIQIKLNGDARNPESEVNATYNNVKIKVLGKLLDKTSQYKIEMVHDELKGFLFSWGFIDETLLNYFYDKIPFSLSVSIKQNNVSDLSLKIKDTTITGSILKEKVKKDIVTNVILKSDNLNIKGIIKRLSNTDMYVDLFLKIIRSVPYNLDLSFAKVTDYDNRKYENVIFNLQKAGSTQKFIFELSKGLYHILLNSDIINSNIFEGDIDIVNYTLPPDLMDGDLLNLQSGNLDAKLKFKTNGTNSYQLLSNLNSNYSVNITNGKLKGISDYETIFDNISNLANITTNNIVYVLENSVKSGDMNFKNLSISGKVENANVKDSIFKLISHNIDFSGKISGNLIQKNLSIEGLFEIEDIAPEKLLFIYNISGFLNNLTGKTDTTNIISKIKPNYLQKKKKDLSE